MENVFIPVIVSVFFSLLSFHVYSFSSKFGSDVCQQRCIKENDMVACLPYIEFPGRFSLSATMSRWVYVATSADYGATAS